MRRSSKPFKNIKNKQRGIISSFECDCCKHDCSFQVYSSTNNLRPFFHLLDFVKGTFFYIFILWICLLKMFQVIDFLKLTILAYSSVVFQIIRFFSLLDTFSILIHIFSQVFDLFIEQLKLKHHSLILY